MITDNSNGRLNEIKTFAKDQVGNYSAKGYTVSLYSDFAALSMEFSITKEGK